MEMTLGVGVSGPFSLPYMALGVGVSGPFSLPYMALPHLSNFPKKIGSARFIANLVLPK